MLCSQITSAPVFISLGAMYVELLKWRCPDEENLYLYDYRVYYSIDNQMVFINVLTEL